MARNRVIYQSEGIFVNTDASLGAVKDTAQLSRVQSANYSYTINRQDVNQYGELARIDSLVLDPPTVSVDFSYYLTDGQNEHILGFYVQTGIADGSALSAAGNFASGHLTAGSGVNVYIVTSPEGDDLNTAAGGGAAPMTSANDKVMGIGNCYLTDYSIDLSVGSLPTASVTMEGANIQSSDADDINNPAVNQTDGTSVNTKVLLPDAFASGSGQSISALRPGDITLNLTDFDTDTFSDIDGADSIHIQSCSLSVPLSRTPLDRLGSKFAYARTVDFPVVTTLNVSAIMNEQQSKNLSTLLEQAEKDVSITMKAPDGTTPAIKWDFKGALVESENWSSSIGSNKTVDLTFTAQIGGPEDITDGVFLSGSNYTSPYFV
tara:strand:- start:3245 stop:4375 length:1131 start_codon:yes stop_codon:yes gene_type:complete